MRLENESPGPENCHLVESRFLLRTTGGGTSVQLKKRNAWYSLAPDDFADYEKAADKIWPLLKAYKDFLQ